MKSSNLLVLGAGAAAVWYVFSRLSKPAKVILDSVEGAIAYVYETLTFAAPIQVEGDVDDLQGNVLGPIASFPAAHDRQGNTYLRIGGRDYMLGPRDSNDNFTAIPVTYAK